MNTIKGMIEDLNNKNTHICGCTTAGELIIALERLQMLEEQQPCETIKEIPKDYKYDTETEDFLVYRHKYTGHEIHIEKPVPRYRIEQPSFEKWLSSFNTESAPQCFTAVQELKRRLEQDDGIH